MLAKRVGFLQGNSLHSDQLLAQALAWWKCPQLLRTSRHIGEAQDWRSHVFHSLPYIQVFHVAMTPIAKALLFFCLRHQGTQS